MKRSEMTKKQLTYFFLEKSWFFGDWSHDRLYMEFGGELSSIPNIKRGRITTKRGASIINKSAMCKLLAMQIHFTDWTQTTGVQPVFMPDHFPLIMFLELPGNKKFDAIGSAESVADWLEPASKPVGRKQTPRGWGVGVYEDDTDLIVVPMKTAHTGNLGSKLARITVQPFERCRGEILTLFARSIL